MIIPSAIMFIFLADFFHMDQSTIGAPFVFSYLFASLIQLTILLYMAHVLTLCMWKRKIDPDNATIPYLTATGDFLGSLLLAFVFWFLQAVGHPYDPDTLVPASSLLTTSSRVYYLRPNPGV
jgi:solute carrier family 41